jgi:hypothetical protein
MILLTDFISLLCLDLDENDGDDKDDEMIKYVIENH